MKKVRMTKKKNIWNLCKIEEIGKEEFGKRISNCMEKNKKEGENSEENWIRMQENITKELIDYVKGVRKKKPWVTDAMIIKMKERRQAKKRMDEEGKRKYRKLNKELSSECEKVRKKWLDEQCNEIEELEKTGKHEEAYRKIKDFNGGGGGAGGSSKCIERAGREKNCLEKKHLEGGKST
ncbi:hypothetical protein J437_LFUL014110 [Ladona fulva]|uniref:Uncharacterized protein n=1 Tax=Ladona fulva TaxID=123851 RepID=A0A8K0KIX7_LADFU|nr:hypothetical protein J437_LFUL014110 [Ladona fulva]